MVQSENPESCFPPFALSIASLSHGNIERVEKRKRPFCVISILLCENDWAGLLCVVVTGALPLGNWAIALFSFFLKHTFLRPSVRCFASQISVCVRRRFDDLYERTPARNRPAPSALTQREGAYKRSRHADPLGLGPTSGIRSHSKRTDYCTVVCM